MPTYTFNHWEINGVTYTSVPLNFTVTADTTIMALYIEKGVTPPVVQAGFPIWVIPVVLIGMGAVYVILRAEASKLTHHTKS